MLTQQQVDSLEAGTEIYVRYPGSRGFVTHAIIAVDEYGRRYANAAFLDRTDVSPLSNELHNVGEGRMNTHVELKEN